MLTNRFLSFTYSSNVRDLGVVLDSSLTFSDHILTLTRSCYFHLRRLRAIKRSITPIVFATIVYAFICSRIDYYNSLLMGLPKSRLSANQSVLNAVQDVLHAFLGLPIIPPTMYMTEILHWLPIASRIKFKVVCVLVSKSQLGLAPAISLALCANQCLQYLPDLCALLIVWIFCPSCQNCPGSMLRCDWFHLLEWSPSCFL